MVSVSESNALSGPGTLCRAPTLCVGLSVSGPGARCVGARRLCRSLCRAPRAPAPGWAAVSVSGPALSGSQFLFVSGPGAPLSAVSVSGPGALRPSLCRGPTRPCRGFVSESGTVVCVGRNIRGAA